MANRIAFHPPHVLIFDTRFIEVRHVETGRLVQIMQGKDVRCTWDGRGTRKPNALAESASAPDTALEQSRIHAVMTSEPAGANQHLVYQHVFELVPTVQLTVPSSSGSLQTT